MMGRRGFIFHRDNVGVEAPVGMQRAFTIIIIGERMYLVTSSYATFDIKVF